MNQSANADDCDAELGLVDPEEPEEEEVRNHRLIPLYSRRGLRSSSAQNERVVVIVPKKGGNMSSYRQKGRITGSLCTKKGGYDVQLD